MTSAVGRGGGTSSPEDNAPGTFGADIGAYEHQGPRCHGMASAAMTAGSTITTGRRPRHVELGHVEADLVLHIRLKPPNERFRPRSIA